MKASDSQDKRGSQGAQVARTIMPTKLRVKSLSFRAGSSAASPKLTVDLPAVTILVGPNSSGKSSALKEIEQVCHGQNPELKLLREVQFILPDQFEEARELLKPLETTPPNGQSVQANHFWIGRPTIRTGESKIRQQVDENAFRSWFNNKHIQQLASILVRPYTLRLDGRSRFDLVEPKPSGPLDEAPENHLWALFKDDDARERVRQFTEAAFGSYYVVDPTGMQQFRAKLSPRAPTTTTEEQALDQTARDFHTAADFVTDMGDGVKASVGLVSAVMSVPQQILLIDEPEAFLHPTLARRVGETLAIAARKREASLIVATHSPDFLMGCIQAVPDTRIVRVTYENGQGTARSIEPNAVMALMKEPLLRSTNAFRAMFTRGVIVSEADSDRAFYEEVNRRLIAVARGVEDCLFLNAQNWNTIGRVAGPLRGLGIPAAAIYDFDVLLDDQFSQIWPLVQLPDDEMSRLQELRNEVRDKMKKVGRAHCKKDGVSALPKPDQSMAKKLLSQFGEHGVFIVPVGELEGWLQTLGVPRGSNAKSMWLTRVFEKMGSDPEDENFVRAKNGDVWKFLQGVGKWIDDPTRKGIPL